MKYKIGDVVWYKKANCKCVIEEAHSAQATSDYYHVSYVREINKGKPNRSAIVMRTKAAPEDLSDYLIHCPICGKNLPVLNGLVGIHPQDGPLCYGSYLPLK